MADAEDPRIQLLEACAAVSAEHAKGWFAACGYVL